MKRWFAVIVAVMFGVAIHAAPVKSTTAAGLRHVTELASDWRFTRGDVAGADSPGLDDSGWQRVSVPHDWAIAGPFDKDNNSGGAGAFLPGGVSFYRRHIALPAGDEGKRIFVEFDGVMAHSKVWWNGHLLGERPNGYVSFGYDVTEGARFGADNVLMVRTDTSQQPASRWYEGAGIYRKVRLVVEEPVHVARWGTFVTTGEVSAASAKVRVQVAVMNQSEKDTAVRVEVQIDRARWKSGWDCELFRADGERERCQRLRRDCVAAEARPVGCGTSGDVSRGGPRRCGWKDTRSRQCEFWCA